MNGPAGVYEDLLGSVYVTEYYGHVVTIASPTGNTVIAGTRDVYGFGGDGGLATSAILYYPSHIAGDAYGNIYIADTFNHCIRKVTVSTGIITTVAGVGEVSGFSGDGGQATKAKLYFPSGAAVDIDGNIYIADTSNQCIRKVSASTGIMTTIAGVRKVFDFSGDGGPATSATMYEPNGVAVDIVGNIYIADTYNHCIRMVSVSTGIITTVAGTGKASGFSGDGGAATLATLNYPDAVAVDRFFDIYIADSLNNCIRKVSASTGVITTIVGTGGVYGDSPDGVIATLANLGFPTSVAVGDMDIYFTDENRIRIIR